MKKFSIISAMFLLMGMLFGSQVMAQGRIDLGGAKSAQQCVNVTDDGFTATFSFSSIESTEVNTEKGVFSYITMEDTYPTGNIGEPTLPAANKLLAVPFGAENLSVKVKSYTTSTYRLMASRPFILNNPHFTKTKSLRMFLSPIAKRLMPPKVSSIVPSLKCRSKARCVVSKSAL